MRLDTLPPPSYRKRLEKDNALNRDIISAIEKNFDTGVNQTRQFAKQFKGSNHTETAENVWNFLKDHIIYKRDSDQDQIIRLPARFIKDGTGDCKSFSLTAASILANLGVPNVRFRYAAYLNSDVPTHVYVVCSDENGSDIIVDGVWKEFNSEKQPQLKFDHRMKVYTLSGIGNIDETTGLDLPWKYHYKDSVGHIVSDKSTERAVDNWVRLNSYGVNSNKEHIWFNGTDANPGTYFQNALSEQMFMNRYHELSDPAPKGYNIFLPTYINKGPGPTNLIGWTNWDSQFRYDIKSGVYDSMFANMTQEQMQSWINAMIKASEYRYHVSPGGLVKVVQDLAKTVWTAIKTVALAVPRNAYKTLIEFNVHGMATQLKKTLDLHPNDLKAKWESLGGDFPTLRDTIINGSKKQSVFGIDESIDGIGSHRKTYLQKLNGASSQERERMIEKANKRYESLLKKGIKGKEAIIASTSNGIGIAIAAILLTAGPIIAAMSGLLKSFGLGDETTDSEGNTKTSSVVDILDQVGKAATAFGKDVSKVLFDPTDPDNKIPVDLETGKDTGFKMGTGGWLLLGGGALLLLTSGKRK